jgi:hypothetical protein
MPFKVMTKAGVPIVAETPEDAIALAEAVAAKEAASERRMRRANGQPKPPTPDESPAPPSVAPRPQAAQAALSVVPAGAWTPPAELGAFYESLTDEQKAAVRTIALARGRDVSLEQVRVATGEGTRREASLLIGACRRVAERYGLDWSDIATFRIQGARHERTSIYQAGPMLRGEGANSG